jgi:hypothetical protein
MVSSGGPERARGHCGGRLGDLRPHPPGRPCLPRAVNNLAQALVAAYAAKKAICDESSARAAVTEVTAD